MENDELDPLQQRLLPIVAPAQRVALQANAQHSLTSMVLNVLLRELVANGLINGTTIANAIRRGTNDLRFETASLPGIDTLEIQQAVDRLAAGYVASVSPAASPPPPSSGR